MRQPNRRKVLISVAAAAGVAGVGGGLLWQRHRDERAAHDEHAEHRAPAPAPDPAFPNALRLPGAEGMYGVIDSPSALIFVAKSVRHELMPGKPGPMLAYEVEHQGKTYFNPVLRARTGALFRARLWNALEETSIIHWHGFTVDSNNDGHPHYAVGAGATYDYFYTVANRAATYWYHPHPHHLTGKQVYLGLAGLFIVEDEQELALQQALDLRFGETDVPLILQDKQLDENGQLVYSPGAQQRFHGFLGNEVLVNLTPRPHFDAATRIYRFRLLNGSNARVYRLAFLQGEQPLAFQLIGTDGGLLDRPYQIKEAFVAPGERLDVLLDLTNAAPGDAVMLASLPFEAMHGESANAQSGAHSAHSQHAAHHGGTDMGGGLANGEKVELLKLRVIRKTGYDRPLPDTLARLEPLPALDAKPRVIILDQSKMAWRINRATYDVKATPITVKRGSSEVWEVRNVTRSMPHPMHIHGFQFRMLSREGSPEQQRQLSVADNGLAASDLGWKDTILAWPGETVRIAIDFSHPFLGDQVYMIHCHNLEHEDGGMMLNLKVAA
jgi:FtsP/CotA-like multicopper oxidase with cupredoxin domain